MNEDEALFQKGLPIRREVLGPNTSMHRWKRRTPS